MDNYLVRRATFEDFDTLKSLMLGALESDPDAFSVTLDEYQDNSNLWWESYLYPFLADNQQDMFFGVFEDAVVSMGGVIYEDKKKKSHIASLVWVYTIPEFRGKGFSKIIIKNILDEIQSRKDIKKISLMVAATQVSAVELYKKFGFDLNGVLKKELKSGDKFSDVYIMEKLFS